jgi:hypothetical protein
MGIVETLEEAAGVGTVAADDGMQRGVELVGN